MIGRSYFLAPATGLLFTHSAKQRKSSALGAELLNGDIEGEGLGGSRRPRKQRDRPRGVPYLPQSSSIFAFYCRRFRIFDFQPRSRVDRGAGLPFGGDRLAGTSATGAAGKQATPAGPARLTVSQQCGVCDVGSDLFEHR